MLHRINRESDKDNVMNTIKYLDVSKQWEVIIRPKKSFRSLPQNKLYWLWLSCIADETGNDRNDLHDYFKDAYLPTKEVRINNLKRIVLMSTTELKTNQFKQYLENIKYFALSILNITLPNPDDLHFAEFYEKYKEYI